MDCARAREIADLHAAGELEDPEAEELLRHAESCESCRALLAEAANAAELARDALRHFEPGAGFESSVLDRIASEPATTPAEPRRTRRILRIAAPAAVAAAAAVILAATLVVPSKPEPAVKLLEGELPGGRTAIAEGEKVTAEADLPLGLAGGTRAVMTRGSAFTFAAGRLEMDRGSCYMVTVDGPGDEDRAPRPAPLLSAAGLDAKLRGDVEVYLRAAPAPDAPESPLAALLDALFPPVYAEGKGGAGTLLMVFSGEATVECNGTALELRAGQAVFADRHEAFEIRSYVERCEKALADAESASRELAPSVERYRGVIASYERSLAAKRLRRAELAARDDAPQLAELEELALRIRIVEEAKAAHEESLARMLSRSTEGRREELAEVKLRMELVREGEGGHVAAVQRLMNY